MNIKIEYDYDINQVFISNNNKSSNRQDRGSKNRDYSGSIGNSIH